MDRPPLNSEDLVTLRASLNVIAGLENGVYDGSSIAALQDVVCVLARHTTVVGYILARLLERYSDGD
jgi:hypothetical protein